MTFLADVLISFSEALKLRESVWMIFAWFQGALRNRISYVLLISIGKLLISVCSRLDKLNRDTFYGENKRKIHLAN